MAIAFTVQIANYAGALDNTEDHQTALENGVKDVVNRMMKISPESMFMFTGIANNTAGNSYVAIADTDKIIDVSRYKVSTEEDRNCVEIPASLRGEVQSTTSLHAATKEFPVYYKLSGKLYVVPDQTTVNKISVNKVVYGEVTNPTTSSSAIANFPTGMIPLVIMYASTKIILEKMAEYTSLPTALNLSSLISAGEDIVSAAPDFGLYDAIFGQQGSLYNQFSIPALSAIPSISDITNLTALDTALASGAVDNDTDQIATQKWFDILSDFIEDDEDTELSRAQVEKITAYLQWYQQALGQKLQKFNGEWQAYSTQLTNAIQIMSKESDLKVQEYATALQKFQAGWQQIATQVNAEVQAFGVNLQRATTEYKWYADRYLFIMQEYEKAFQPYADKGQPAA